MGINQQATTTITLNNEQAKRELDELQNKIKNLIALKKKAEAEGDITAYKKVSTELNKSQKEANAYQRQLESVKAVLADMSGATLKQLQNALRSVNTQLSNTRRGTTEFKSMQQAQKQLQAEIDKTTGKMRLQQNPLQQVTSLAKGLLPAFSFAAIVALGRKAFSNLVDATQTFGDKYNEIVGGITAATGYFWKTLSGGNWSNFLTNLGEAARLGREYVKVLDDIDDRTLGLKIEEADARARILQLEEDLRNQALTKDQRLASGQERIRIEEELAEKRATLAKRAFDNEIENNVKLKQIGRERFIQLQTEWDSEDRKQAERYAKQMKRLEDLSREQSKPQYTGSSRFSSGTPVNHSSEIARLNAEIAKTPAHIKAYGDAFRVFEDINDKERQKVVQTYEAMKAAENSAAENTKRVVTMVNSLIAETERAKRDALNKTIAAIQEAPDLEELLTSNIETQKAAINAYFETAGEGSFEAFMAGIEKAQKERAKIDEMKIFTPEDGDKEVEYLLEKYQETAEGQITILEVQRQLNLISEAEYQDRITEIYRQAENERTALRREGLEKAMQASQLAANFVVALMELELTKAGENEEKKKAIRKKYADIQFIISAAQIVTDTAVSIMKSFSELGPIAGAIFAGIIGATGALQLGIANAQRQQVKGLKTGGYTGSGNENEPAGVVHRGEWVAPAWMVRQPDTSRIIDTLELMRTNRSTLNTSAFKDFPAMGYRGSNFVTGQAQPNETKVVINSDPEVAAMLNQVKNALDQNTKATKEFMNWKPKVAAETIEKELNTLQYIRKHSGL